MQDVTTPTFFPHGGPITHSSTRSKPDSPIHHWFARLFLARGLVCNSRATFLVTYSSIRCNTYSRCFEPLSHSISGIERLPARSKLPMIPPYFALDIFLRFDSRVTFRHLSWCYLPDNQHCSGPFFRSYPLSFVRTMKTPKKRWRLHHDDLKQRNEDINI